VNIEFDSLDPPRVAGRGEHLAHGAFAHVAHAIAITEPAAKTDKAADRLGRRHGALSSRRI